MIPLSFALRTSLKSFVLNSSVARFIITLLLLRSFPPFPLLSVSSAKGRRCVLSLSDEGQRPVLPHYHSQIRDRDLFVLSARWVQSAPLFLLPLWSVGAACMGVTCMHITQLCCSSPVLSYLFPLHLSSFISFLFLWLFLF